MAFTSGGIVVSVHMIARGRHVMALATALWLHAAPVSGQAKMPFQEVDVDLRAAIVNDTLPFDVPFIVSATIGASITEVSAWLAEVPEPVGNAPFACPAEGDPAWRTIRPWREPAGIAEASPMAGETQPVRKFRLLFPALDVNRFYCVKFALGPARSLTPEELSTFRRNIVEVIDIPLRAYATADRVPASETLALRRALLLAIQKVTGEMTPRAKAGSIFDPSRSAGDVHSELTRRLHDVVDPQAARQSAIESLREDEEALAEISGRIERRWNDVLDIARQRSLDPEITEDIASQLRAQNLGLLRLRESLPAAKSAWSPSPVDEALARTQQAEEQAESGMAVLDRLALSPEPEAVTQLKADFEQELGTLQPLESELNDLKGSLEDRQRALEELTLQFGNEVAVTIELLTTSLGSFDTRHGWYVSMDAGLAYGWDIDEAFGYLGTNIYFRPVNKDAPLQSFGSFAQSFTRRVSALIGLTVTGQTEEADRREALIGGRVLVVGGGLRLTDSIRVNGGGLVFKAVDPNPLVTERRVEISPFISLSFDIDVVGMLGDLGGAFGVNSGTPSSTRRPGVQP